MPPAGSPGEMRDGKSSRMPLIISALVIIAALFASFYVYGLSLSLEKEGGAQNATSTESGDAESASIEQELEVMNVDDSDEDLNAIDALF